MFPVLQALLWSLAIQYASMGTVIPSRHIPLAVVTVFCFITVIFLLRSVQGKIFTIRCQNPCPPEDAPKAKRPGNRLGLEILRDLA